MREFKARRSRHRAQERVTTFWWTVSSRSGTAGAAIQNTKGEATARQLTNTVEIAGSLTISKDLKDAKGRGHQDHIEEVAEDKEEEIEATEETEVEDVVEATATGNQMKAGRKRRSG